MRGVVVLRSLEPVKEKPAIYSIGGFTAISEDGREYHFDWCESYTSCEHDEGGRLIFESDLRNFDDEYFKDSSEVNIDELTPEFITSSKLKEVYYECFEDENEENFVHLEIVGFGVQEWDGEKYIEKEFSDSEIQRYNKEEVKHLTQEKV